MWLLMCKHCITFELCRDNVNVCVWSVVRLRVCVECGCVLNLRVVVEASVDGNESRAVVVVVVVVAVDVVVIEEREQQSSYVLVVVYKNNTS